MKLYVLGFLFNEKLTQVALIRKTKPEWQAGKYNGIGGKIEKGESPLFAIIREFEEETGGKANENFWQLYCNMKSYEFEVYTFSAIGDLTDLKTTTEEEVVIIDVDQVNILRDKLLSNVPWLIEMAIDKLKNNEFNYSVINYY